MRLHSVILGLCAAGLYVFHPVDVQHFSLEGKPDPRFVPETPGKAAPFIAVSVADLDRQLKWYRDNLGFEVHSQGTVPGKGIKFALLKKEGALLELLQIPESRPRPGKPRDPSSASLTQGFSRAGWWLPMSMPFRHGLKKMELTLPLSSRPPRRSVSGLRGFRYRGKSPSVLRKLKVSSWNAAGRHRGFEWLA